MLGRGQSNTSGRVYRFTYDGPVWYVDEDNVQVLVRGNYRCNYTASIQNKLSALSHVLCRYLGLKDPKAIVIDARKIQMN